MDPNFFNPNTPVDVTRESKALLEIIGEAARRTLHASYADRNPILGKMVTCPFCRRRRRMHAAQPCCNSNLIQNKAVAPRPKGRKYPRLTRNSPPLFLMRQILLDWEKELNHLTKARTAQALIEGAPRHEVLKPVTMDHLGPLAERYILWMRKKESRRVRNEQKLSRRINRA